MNPNKKDLLCIMRAYASLKGLSLEHDAGTDCIQKITRTIKTFSLR